MIQAIGEPLILLSDAKQFLADMLDRLSGGHAAEFLGFALVLRRSFARGSPWKIHFPAMGCRSGRCARPAYCARAILGQSNL